jgi:hypothetical protein
MKSFCLTYRNVNVATIDEAASDSKYEDDSLLRYSTLMMEVVHTSEMPIYFYEATRSHIPENCHLQQQTCI